jgi:hypothetical protein
MKMMLEAHAQPSVGFFYAFSFERIPQNLGNNQHDPLRIDWDAGANNGPAERKS